MPGQTDYTRLLSDKIQDCVRNGDEDTTGLEPQDAAMLVALFYPVQENARYIAMSRVGERTYYNLFQNTYKGHDHESLEQYRQEGLEAITDTDDPLERISILNEYGGVIDKTLRALDDMEFFTKLTKMHFSLDVCRRLLEQSRLSLTEIQKALPSLTLGDIYTTALIGKIEVTPTPAELEQIRQEYVSTYTPVMLRHEFDNPYE